ncbi:MULTISPECIES: ATP-binding protein [unclassified Adlercreutzia]|uniref:ATP-binding protein n=1 Tax=unclassified Adlercreutzia TaxID=2636013 RepID=UPI0013ED85B6|nr:MULTISPECIES: ATP-binding protein [unclassified Adlercreutzia]
MESSKLRHIAAIVLALALALAAVGAYITQLNRVVADNMLLSMGEVSQHDVESIEASIEISLDRLEDMENRFELHGYGTVADLQDYLRVESAASEAFNEVLLLDEAGRLYTNAGRVLDPGEHDYEDFFPAGTSRYVMRLNGSDGVLKAEDEALLYGIKLEDIAAEGVRFAALLGVCDISDVRNQMRIESFDGRGYSSVIGEDGFYVVNARRILGRGGGSTFYEVMDGAQFDDGMDASAVLARVGARETFATTCLMPSGEQLMLSFAPIEGTSWTFGMAVPKSVFDERSSRFVIMTMVMLVVVVCALGVMMALLFRFLHRSVEANARAEARADFLSSMSHEIRTPLNGIIGLNHLMERHLDDRAQMAGYVAKMGSTAHYLLALVNDILDMSKLQAGKVELSVGTFDLDELVDELCAMQRENVEGRGIAFECARDVARPRLMGDAVRIKQIMMNIISNAAKFTPAGGVISFSVAQDAPAGDVVTTRFSVADTGCGMSREFVAHIFDAFSQEVTSATEGQKGTGLGMSISYLLAQQMGGDILVESELGRGSRFEVVLPLEVAPAGAGGDVRAGDAAAVGAGAAAAAGAGGDGAAGQGATADADADAGAGASAGADAGAAPAPTRALSVLVAEDNELNAEILVSILEEEGMGVRVAANGEEAVAAFGASGAGDIDVILMDAHMPVMDGYEAARAIRALDRPDARTVRIIACTASTFKEDQDRADASGMDDFVAKPIDVKTLLAKLASIRKSS